MAISNNWGQININFANQRAERLRGASSYLGTRNRSAPPLASPPFDWELMLIWPQLFSATSLGDLHQTFDKAIQVFYLASKARHRAWWQLRQEESSLRCRNRGHGVFQIQWIFWLQSSWPAWLFAEIQPCLRFESEAQSMSHKLIQQAPRDESMLYRFQSAQWDFHFDCENEKPRPKYQWAQLSC